MALIQPPDAKVGEYEKLQVYSNLFYGIALLGKPQLLDNHIKKSFALIDSIPSAFYRGRSASNLFITLAMIDKADFIFSDGQDYLKKVMDYLDENLDKYPETNYMKKRDSNNTYPLYTMLNAIAILKKPEYLTYKRNWLEDAAAYLTQLPPGTQMSQSQYYFVSLSNLGRLAGAPLELKAFFSNAFSRYSREAEEDPLAQNMHDAYLVQSAAMFACEALIPTGLIDRMVHSFKSYQPGEVYRNGAYGGSYVLSVLDTIDELSLLFEPNPLYEGEAPFLWLINHFTDGALAEQKTIPYLNHALINAALRMRGHINKASSLSDI